MLRTQAFGLEFKHPLGLAAGYDKHCQVYPRAVPALGFSFCEVGGITRWPQIGHLPIRLFRSEKYEALWNHMGFNNPGADHARVRMERNLEVYGLSPVPVGLNLGKGKDTTPEKAVQEYCYVFEKLRDFVDFVVVNPSSPNTAGMRELRKRDNFLALMQALKTENQHKPKDASVSWRELPIGFKISPDDTDEQIADCVEVARSTKTSFIVATNTTTSRAGVDGWNIPSDRGGISGKLLAELAEARLVQLRKVLRGTIPLIGVGGIGDGRTLYRRILKGADLCQVYTAWVFEGPDFVRRALMQLVDYLRVDGFKCVADAVGKDVC